MALTFTEKAAAYDSTDTGPWNTASVTASANKLYLIGCYISGTSPSITAVSGAGLGSFTKVIEDNGAARAISVWRASSASPGAGAAIAITGTGTPTGCAWTVIEVDGQDTSGSNGSGAIVQSVSNSGTATSLTATLAAYTGANSRPVAFCGNAQNATITAELTGGTNSAAGGPNTSFLGQWSPTTQDTTPNFTWSGSVAARAISLEIKMLSAGTPFTTSLAGSVTSSGALAKAAAAPKAGSVTPSGALTKLAGKALAGSATQSGALAKAVGKPLAGSITASGTVARVRSALLALAGSLTASGALAKAVGKAVSGSLTPTGSPTKAAARAVGGSLSPAGSVAKAASKPLAGSLTGAGALVRAVGKALAGSITGSGADSVFKPVVFRATVSYPRVKWDVDLPRTKWQDAPGKAKWQTDPLRSKWATTPPRVAP